MKLKSKSNHIHLFFKYLYLSKYLELCLHYPHYSSMSTVKKTITTQIKMVTTEYGKSQIQCSPLERYGEISLRSSYRSWGEKHASMRWQTHETKGEPGAVDEE